MADDGASEEKTLQGTTARGGQPRQAARRRGQPDRGKARDGERRRTSLPVVTMPVRLNSEAALALVRRPLGNTLFDIALMDMVVPRFTGEREVAELRQLLIDAIATARVEIAQAIERAEGQKRKAGCKLAVSYSDPREVTLQVGSPIAMQLPELLQQLDRGVAEIDALWLAGEITHGAREQEVRRLAQPLEQLGKVVSTARRRAFTAAKSRGKEAEVQEAAEEVRAKLGGEAQAEDPPATEDEEDPATPAAATVDTGADSKPPAAVSADPASPPILADKPIPAPALVPPPVTKPNGLGMLFGR